MIKNKTDLQKAIITVIKGHKIDEVIHALEVIKIDLLLFKIANEKTEV